MFLGASHNIFSYLIQIQIWQTEVEEYQKLAKPQRLVEDRASEEVYELSGNSGVLNLIFRIGAEFW
jgi:hypothetical protein